VILISPFTDDFALAYKREQHFIKKNVVPAIRWTNVAKLRFMAGEEAIYAFAEAREYMTK
jgi:hypothetical protein